MFGWFRVRSPLTIDQRNWIDQRFEWLVAILGVEILSSPIVTPTDDFFPEVYCGSREDAEVMFSRVCGYMGVARERIDLRFYTSQSADIVATAFNPALDRQFALGVYQEGVDRITIWLEESQLCSPTQAVATMAHELSHVRLLADGLSIADSPDNEPLTDLAVILLGLGIFSANSVIQEASWRFGNQGGWRVAKSGYLTMAEHSYALAKLAVARGEAEPKWAKFLRKDVLALMRQELRHIKSSPKDEYQAASSAGYACSISPASNDPKEDPGQDSETHDDYCREADEDFESGSTEQHSGDEWFTKGLALAIECRHQDAIQAFVHAIRANSKDEEAWLHCAKSRIALEQFDAAIEDCSNAIRIEPDDIDSRCCRASAQLWLGRYDDALPDLKCAIQIESKDPYPWLLRGIAYLGLGQFKKAVSDLNKAVRFAPTWADSYLARSRAYDGLGKNNQARADLAEAIMRDPRLDDDRERLARLAGRV